MTRCGPAAPTLPAACCGCAWRSLRYSRAASCLLIRLPSTQLSPVRSLRADTSAQPGRFRLALLTHRHPGQVERRTGCLRHVRDRRARHVRHARPPSDDHPPPANSGRCDHAGVSCDWPWPAARPGGSARSCQPRRPARAHSRRDKAKPGNGTDHSNERPDMLAVHPAGLAQHVKALPDPEHADDGEQHAEHQEDPTPHP